MWREDLAGLQSRWQGRCPVLTSPSPVRALCVIVHVRVLTQAQSLSVLDVCRKWRSASMPCSCMRQLVRSSAPSALFCQQ